MQPYLGAQAIDLCLGNVSYHSLTPNSLHLVILLFLVITQKCDRKMENTLKT